MDLRKALSFGGGPWIARIILRKKGAVVDVPK
jgi:hypothetical protein